MQFYFTVHGPSSHLFGKDGLKVGFEKEEDASRWREAFRDAISNLSTDMVGRHLSADLAARSPSRFQESPLGRDKSNSVANLAPVSCPGSEAFMDHSNLAKVGFCQLPVLHAQVEGDSKCMTDVPSMVTGMWHTHQVVLA